MQHENVSTTCTQMFENWAASQTCIVLDLARYWQLWNLVQPGKVKDFRAWLRKYGAQIEYVDINLPIDKDRYAYIRFNSDLDKTMFILKYLQ